MRRQGKCTAWVDSIFPIFRKWMRRHCDTPQEFVLEDFRRWCEPHIKSCEIEDAPHPNAWGGLVQRAKTDGLIAVTGQHQKSVHASAHGREVKVWRRAA